MSDKQTNDVKLRLEKVRLSFPNLYAKDRYGRYSASFLFEKGSEAYKKVTAAIQQAATAQWGAQAAATLKSLAAKDDLCIHDGDTKPDQVGYAGNYYLSGTSRRQPRLVDRAREEVLEDNGTFYPGCHVNVIVNIWPQNNVAKGWKRINCELTGVQFHSDGERLSGGGRIAEVDEFDDLGSNASGAGNAESVEDLF
jgi:hypothetical protein